MPTLSLLIRAAAILVCVTAASGASAAEPYKINVILPLTGGAAFLGKGEQQALQIFQSMTNKEGGINGQPLEFVFHDDQTSPQTTVQIANGIFAEKPAVMLGSSIVAMCNAIAPLLKEGPFDYCLSPGVHPAAGSYQYSTSTDTHALIEALVRYFRLRGLTKIAFISSTDASGQDAERGFNDVLKLPENASCRSSNGSGSIRRMSAFRRRSSASRRPIRRRSSPGRPAPRSRRCSKPYWRPA